MKLFFNFFVLSSILLLASCSDNPTEFDNENVSATHQYFFIDEEEVSFEAFEEFDHERVLVHGKTDETINFLKFSKLEDYLGYGDKNSIPLRKDYNNERLLVEFAEEIGAIEHYDNTGQVMPAYTEYAEKILGHSQELERAPVIMNDFCSGPGNSSMILGVVHPVMPFTWNNRMSEYFSLNLFTTFHLYDRTFFRNHLASFWIQFGWQDRCLEGTFINNRTSSCFHG